MKIRQPGCGGRAPDWFPAAAQDLPTPGFHHLMLNTVDPQKAIDYYSKGFINTHPASWEGYPAIATDNHVLVLFNKVATPPVANSQITAFWHFGWNATDERVKVKELLDKGYTFAPLWTGLGDGSVTISSDTLPGKGGVFGLGETQERSEGPSPPGSNAAGGAGFAYLAGPMARGSSGEQQRPERFNHIHMWEEEPRLRPARTKHLNAKVRPPAPGQTVYTESNCHVDRGVATWPGAGEGKAYYRYPTAGDHVRRCLDELIHGPDRQAAGGNTGPSDGQCGTFGFGPGCLGQETQGRECHLPAPALSRSAAHRR